MTRYRNGDQEKRELLRRAATGDADAARAYARLLDEEQGNRSPEDLLQDQVDDLSRRFQMLVGWARRQGERSVDEIGRGFSLSEPVSIRRRREAREKTRPPICGACNGVGSVRVEIGGRAMASEWHPCPCCRGSGRSSGKFVTCPRCEGRMIVRSKGVRGPCPTCSGIGRVCQVAEDEDPVGSDAD